jgi:FAD/FMN-containing dehydrogenase
VLPVKKGIVVDFYHMNKITDIDTEAQTATVEAGVVWEKLDKALAKKGMTLRLYPSSYPAATVGGWVAQGGTGIGSYEFGWLSDNLISLRAVSPDGEVKEYKGEYLDLISGAEGTSGFISSVTLKIQPLEELEVLSIGCPHASDLQQLIKLVMDDKLPVWSMLFINPRMAELKNKAPLLEHFGHPVEKPVLLPASYILTIAFRKKDSRESWQNW